jgi:hypothetical protein
MVVLLLLERILLLYCCYLLCNIRFTAAPAFHRSTQGSVCSLDILQKQPSMSMMC